MPRKLKKKWIFRVVIVLQVYGAGGCKTSRHQSETSLQESPLEVYRLSQNNLENVLNRGTFVIISAGRNPQNQADRDLSDAAIGKRDVFLTEQLRQNHYRYQPIVGHYGGLTETSYFVYNLPSEPQVFIRLAKQMNQDSIIFSTHGHNSLIYTTGNNTCKANEGSGWKRVEGAAQDDYSVIKTSEGIEYKFILALDFEQLVALQPAMCQ